MQIVIKDSANLTEQEIDEMYTLNLRMYPEFAQAYKQNRYYSYVKPDKLLMFYDHSRRLIADVNIGYRNLNDIGKLAFWGILVAEDGQGQGIAGMANALVLEIARKADCDFVFASTKNEIMDKFLTKRGYYKDITDFFYIDSSTNTKVSFANEGYSTFLCFVKAKRSLPDKVELGQGPI